MTFALSSLSFGLLFALAAVTFGVLTVRIPDLWRRLPRCRVGGSIIGVVCLVWSAMLVMQMLEGDLVRYRYLVKLAVPIVGVLAFFYLDYLFTRALGGLLVLVVSTLLHGAFAQNIPVRPFYSLICYLIGIAGLFLIATPWMLRDWLEKAGSEPSWRRGLTAACAVLSAVLIVFSFLR